MHEWILIEKLNAKTYVEILYSFYAVDPDLKLNRDQGQLRSTLKPLKHHRNIVPRGFIKITPQPPLTPPQYCTKGFIKVAPQTPQTP